MKKQKKSRWFYFKKNLPLTMMALPGIILMILFKYLPLSGIVLAFKQYNIRDGIFGSAWNGLKNFEYLFRTKDAWIITRNTLGYNLMFIVLDLVLAVPAFGIFALTVCLGALSIRNGDEALYLTGGQKLWILFLAGVCLLGLMTAMLVGWTPLSSQVIEGVQGRYLLPLLPFVLLTAKSRRTVRLKGDDGRILFYMCAVDAYVFLRLFGIVSMRL